jgi:hypothetical protein
MFGSAFRSSVFETALLRTSNRNAELSTEPEHERRTEHSEV